MKFTKKALTVLTLLTLIMLTGCNEANTNMNSAGYKRIALEASVTGFWQPNFIYAEEENNEQ